MRKRRVLSGIFPLLLAGTAAGNASSILTLPATPSSQTPSIIERGRPVAESRSAEPAVTGEAADDEKPAWMSQALPDVIRGGVHGDAFPAPERQAEPAEPEVEVEGIVTGPHTPEANGMPVE